MTNPYPTRPGFGLRVHYARKTLILLAQGMDRVRCNKTGEIYSRARDRKMDNCFEMCDGDAVVWALMDAAARESSLYNSPDLARGIELFCGNDYALSQWRATYAHKGLQSLPLPLSLPVQHKQPAYRHNYY